MRWLDELLRRGRAVFSRRRLDAEAAEEIRLHFDREVQRHLESGLTDEKARRAATIDVGNPVALADACREARGFAWLDGVRLDVRHTLRRWRRRPGFVALIVATLALGIGITTALFSVIDAVLLRPLPWPDAGRLVSIHAVEPERLQTPALAPTWNRAPISWSNWQRLARTPALDGVGVFYPVSYERFDVPGQFVSVLYVSSAFLPMLGVHPVIGRHFGAADDSGVVGEVAMPVRPESRRPAPERIALISHRVWQSDYRGAADVIGKPFGLSATYTIVGVLPARFHFREHMPDVVLPIGEMQHNSQYQDLLRAVGRLAPGVPLDAAREVIEPIVRGDVPREQRTARVVPLLDDQVGSVARPLWLLFGGASLLLLVACSTVAGLLLGDARGRRHEMAVRASLGGGRARVLRQLAVEHGLLAAIAISAGLVATFWLTPLLVSLADGTVPRLDTVAVDLRVALFALGLGGVTVVLFGFVPTLTLARTSAREILSEGTGGPRRHRGQRTVVATQVALALVLLVGAGLFAESMFRLTSRPLGFEPAHVATLSFTWSRNRALDPGANDSAARSTAGLSPSERARLGRAEIERGLIDRNTTGLAAVISSLSAIPGVTSVGAVSHLPFLTARAESLVRPHGQPATAKTSVQRQVVTDGYFETMGIEIRRGRGFDVSDRQRPVAVVSRALEERLFSGDAVGEQLNIAEGFLQGTYEIIGVVSDVRHDGFEADDTGTLYLSNARGTPVAHIVVRSAVDASGMLTPLRETIRLADPRLIVTEMHTMDALVSASVAEERLRAMFSSAFAAAALVLAALGLYGLATRLVIDRRRELGVRIALGARPADVRTVVLRDALVMVTAGTVLGLPAALGMSRLVGAFLFGVSPAAPRTFALSIGVLATTALVATLAPAWRAARTDPAAVLREG